MAGNRDVSVTAKTTLREEAKRRLEIRKGRIATCLAMIGIHESDMQEEASLVVHEEMERGHEQATAAYVVQRLVSKHGSQTAVASLFNIRQQAISNWLKIGLPTEHDESSSGMMAIIRAEFGDDFMPSLMWRDIVGYRRAMLAIDTAYLDCEGLRPMTHEHALAVVLAGQNREFCEALEQADDTAIRLSGLAVLEATDNVQELGKRKAILNPAHLATYWRSWWRQLGVVRAVSRFAEGDGA